jgi:hypothetical protein
MTDEGIAADTPPDEGILYNLGERGLAKTGERFAGRDGDRPKHFARKIALPAVEPSYNRKA